MEMLSMLYFPELKTEALEANINFRLFQREIMNSNFMGRELISKEKLGISIPSEDLAALKALNSNIPVLHQQFSGALSRLSAEAEKLLQSLMKV